MIRMRTHTPLNDVYGNQLCSKCRSPKRGDYCSRSSCDRSYAGLERQRTDALAMLNNAALVVRTERLQHDHTLAECLAERKDRLKIVERQKAKLIDLGVSDTSVWADSLKACPKRFEHKYVSTKDAARDEWIPIEGQPGLVRSRITGVFKSLYNNTPEEYLKYMANKSDVFRAVAPAPPPPLTTGTPMWMHFQLEPGARGICCVASTDHRRVRLFNAQKKTSAMITNHDSEDVHVISILQGQQYVMRPMERHLAPTLVSVENAVNRGAYESFVLEIGQEVRVELFNAGAKRAIVSLCFTTELLP